MRAEVNLLQQGANTLADGSRQLADGVQLLVDQVKNLGSGLGEASEFLLAMKDNANTPAMAGFYIPPQVLSYATGEGGNPAAIPAGAQDLLRGLNVDELKKLASAFVSPNGHAMRYLIQTNLNPFNSAAMDQVNAITTTAQGAQPNTTLADASISVVGLPAVLKDTRDYSDHDVRFVIAMTICVVLLISRLRDESALGVRSGVIRTVSSTGGVITAAGLIMAASMYGLLFASL